MNHHATVAQRPENPAPTQDVLDFYASQSALTAPGRHAGLLDDLPRTPADIVRIVQGLLIYEHVAGDFYGIDLDDERRQESHIRPVEAILDAILALDGRPLGIARAPEKRLVGICRHYAVLTVSILRAKGIPARMRGGFGAYFNPGKFEDHWICEYWSTLEGRWIIVDTQFDDVWVGKFNLDHDILDVPRDQFIVAGEAWARCRDGRLDPQAFGIEFSGLRGLWFVAGNLMRDIAALNRQEVLPWDVWGAQPHGPRGLDAEELAWCDELAKLSRGPDANFRDVRAAVAEERLRLPGNVFNALRQRPEEIAA